MDRAAQKKIQRNQSARIEQMINARGNFPAVAVEGFARKKRAGANFIVAVAKTAAGDADAQVRVRTECADEAEFGVHINRRDRQPQRQVCAQKIRLVVIIKSIGRQRLVALEGLVVTELDEIALDRINLRGRKNRGEQRQPQQCESDSFHHQFPNAKWRGTQADSIRSTDEIFLGLLSHRCRHSILKF
jgi:hypothetical protein